MKEMNNSLAFIFPGQGSQSLGMLKDLGQASPEVKQTFELASDIVGLDLWKFAQEGPEERLNLTQVTQPLMLAAGVAVWRAWCDTTAVLPGWMAGHSLGEYTALVCSGALRFDNAVRLVMERARLMQEAVAPGTGAMAAILGLDEPQVMKICNELSGEEIVAPVNFNAPGQIVVAGHAGAVRRAVEMAKQNGARRAVILPVSVPSHCALMQSAAENLDQFIKEIPFETPKIPIIHNVDVASHAAPEVIQDALKKQLYNPVRWGDTIKFVHEQGVNLFFECGPGRVLSGLNKRIVRDCEALSINDGKTLQIAAGRFE